VRKPTQAAEGGPFRYARRKISPTVVVIGLCIVLLLSSVAFGYHMTNTATNPTIVVAKTPAQPVAQPQKPVLAPEPPDPLASLPTDLNAVISAQTAVSASVTVINLDTNKEYDAGKYTQTYEAASTSKLVAVFDYIHQVELGKATLTQSIQGQQAQDIIMRMIVNSDNNAWDKLNGYLRFTGEQKYLNSIGVAGHMTPENIQFSTPAMAKMLQLLYQGKLMNADHQALIYGYMAHTTMNKLIPAALPVDVTVYHKYGEIDGVLHDVAIIKYQGHSFVLVIYTNNPANNMGLYSSQVQLIRALTSAALTDVLKS